MEVFTSVIMNGANVGPQLRDEAPPRVPGGSEMNEPMLFSLLQMLFVSTEELLLIHEGPGIM